MKVSRAEKNKLKIGIFSFFSGAGFLDLGFEKSGYDVLFANEICKDFASVYTFAREQMNMQGVTPDQHSVEDYVDSAKEQYENLKEKISEARKKYDLIGFIGGPPCPDFSVAGKNEGATGKHGRLSQVYMNVIFEFKPDFFVFENVRGLIKTGRHREFFETLIRQAQENDYLTTWELTNALEYGVPQDRDRVIFLGFLRSTYAQRPAQATTIISDFPWQETRKYKRREIKKYPAWPTQEPFQENGKRPCCLKRYIDLAVMTWFTKNNVDKHPNASHHFVPRSGILRMQSYAEGDVSRKCFKRLHRWRYSPAAAYGNNEVHLHPFKVRRLSVAEALAIQSLPKEFCLPPELPLTSMFKTIGNGVPFLLAKGIASGIKRYIMENACSRRVKSSTPRRKCKKTQCELCDKILHGDKQ